MFEVLIVFMVILNLADLVLTISFIKDFGIELEANPLARWIWGKAGVLGLVSFKLFFTVGTVGSFWFALESYIALPGVVIGALVLTWVVARNLTMVQILWSFDSRSDSERDRESRFRG